MSDSELLPPGVDPKTPKIGIRKVTANNDASCRSVMSMRSHTLVTDERDGTDTGPTPLEMTLSSLLGCEGVIINRCAKVMKFEYSGVEMGGEGEVDGRGSRGVQGVRPYFNWVKVDIRVTSNESEQRFEKLKKNVENRCPVLNLFRSAGVNCTINWTLAPHP